MELGGTGGTTDNEETLKREMKAIQAQIDYKNEQYRTYEMYNEKVFRRKRDVLGRQLTRLNYEFGNKLVELNKITGAKDETH